MLFASILLVIGCSDSIRGGKGGDDTGEPEEEDHVFDPDTCTGDLAGTTWFTTYTLADGLSDDSGVCTYTEALSFTLVCDPGSTPDGYQPCAMLIEGNVEIDGTSTPFRDTLDPSRTFGAWFGIEFQSGEQMAVADGVGEWTWIPYSDGETMSFNRPSGSLGDVCGANNAFFMGELSLVGFNSGTSAATEVWGDELESCDGSGFRTTIFDEYEDEFAKWIQDYRVFRGIPSRDRHAWWNVRYQAILPEGLRTVAMRNYGHAIIDWYATDTILRGQLEGVERSYTHGNLSGAQALVYLNRKVWGAIERGQITTPPIPFQ